MSSDTQISNRETGKSVQWGTSILKAFSWIFFAHVASKGALIFSSLILARNLPTDEFATYSYFHLTALTVTSMANVGIWISATRSFARLSNADADQAAESLALIVLSSFLLCIAFVGICLAPVSVLGTALSDHRLLFAATAVLLAGVQLPSAALIALGHASTSAYILAFSSVILIAVVFIAAQASSLEIALYGLMAYAALQACLTYCYTLYVCKAKLIAAFGSISLQSFKATLQFLGPSSLTTLLAGLAPWLVGRIILSNPDGVNQFSLYAIGLQWFSLGMLVASIATKAVGPLMAKLEIGATRKHLGRVAITLVTLPPLALVIITTFLSSIAAEAYGAIAKDDPWIFAGFLVPSVVAAPVQMLGSNIALGDNAKTWAQHTSVWFCMNLLLVYLYSSSGLEYVPASLTASYIALFLLAMRWSRRNNYI